MAESSHAPEGTYTEEEAATGLGDKFSVTLLAQPHHGVEQLHQFQLRPAAVQSEEERQHDPVVVRSASAAMSKSLSLALSCIAATISAMVGSATHGDAAR